MKEAIKIGGPTILPFFSTSICVGMGMAENSYFLLVIAIIKIDLLFHNFGNRRKTVYWPEKFYVDVIIKHLLSSRYDIFELSFLHLESVEI